MLRLGTFVWCALALFLPLKPPSNASEICPPPIPTYEKCPSGSAQEWPLPPWYIAIDTVVEPIEDNRWDYHWCLKNIERLNDEFYVTWRDIHWNGFTMCGGFAGLNLQSHYRPSELRPTTIIVGSSRREIEPNIIRPIQPDEHQPIWNKFLEYVTNIFASVPIDKAGSELAAVGLTIRSTAMPVVINGQQISTRYKVEYSDAFADETSGLKFAFNPDLAHRISDLAGLFDLSNKDAPIEFIESGAPTNVLSSVVVVGPDGYEVGSMPVSLAVPSE